MTELGATYSSASTTFRVWAPNASAVSVVEFDAVGTRTRQTPMAAVDAGCWAVEVADVELGARYRYLLQGPAGSLERIDPYARSATNSVGYSRVYDENAYIWSADPYAAPDWDELVVYELHVGSFDPQLTGRPGTFADAALRLPYLAGLGVTAVELLPVGEFAGDWSGGYNPALPFAVEEAYGGPDGLKAFVDAAHQRGIAVILDVVYNHFGPSDLDLWRFDGWSSQPQASDTGGIYFYEDWRAGTPWGSRPDFGRTEVRRYIRDNVLDWLTLYRIDGLRLDATAYLRSVDGSGNADIGDGWRLMRECADDVAAIQPWKILIAEDMRDAVGVTQPTSQGGAGFGSQWDPGFVGTVRAAIEAVDDAQRSMTELATALDRQYGDRWLSRVVFTESHDADSNGRTRVPAEIDPAEPGSWFAKKRSTLGAALVLTSPGIPMLFQGQEFLESSWFHETHAVDWTKASTNAGIVELYRDLIRMRRDWYGITGGLRGAGLNVHHLNDADKLIGYHRWDHGGPGDDTIVLLNFSARSYPDYRIGVPRAGEWLLRFNSDWDGYDRSFASTASYSAVATDERLDGMAASAAFGIGPYTALVLSQQP